MKENPYPYLYDVVQAWLIDLGTGPKTITDQEVSQLVTRIIARLAELEEKE